MGEAAVVPLINAWRPCSKASSLSGWPPWPMASSRVAEGPPSSGPAGAASPSAGCWGSVAIGLVVPDTFVLGGVLFSQAAAAGTLAASYHGLAQPLTITLGFGWLIVIALPLRPEQPSRPTPQPARPATTVP